jgi:NAD(P)-dependent dehydrogenase (short-subunit alcohol dehydrogenase family)
VTAGVYVVTGAGSGIGRAVVDDLLAQDLSTIVGALDISEPGLEDLRVAHGDRVRAVHCDVTDRTAIHRAIGEVASQGQLVGLVNAAGTHTLVPSLELEPEHVRMVLGVHIEASLYAAQAAATAMIAHRQGGSIVNFSSVAADFAWPRRLPYAVAKAGLGALTRTLAVEWAEFDIRVNSVAPGYVATPMIRTAIEQGAFDPQERLAMHALNRFAEPVEVARAVRFLLSSDASFITGETLRVDGGFTIKR